MNAGIAEQEDYRIDARGLSKTFGETAAVRDLNMRVGAGEIYGLVGPDGAGKTTTMRLLCGAMVPDAGEVTIGGYSMTHNPDLAREQIGYLSQRFSLYEEMSVLENLRFFAEVRGLSRQEWQPRTMETLEFVGLAEFKERRAGLLSGGMKQKLGLATALVHWPQVLLLDEPTGGVDPVTRQDFWQLIIRLVSEEGISVVVSTPYMDEAVRCTRVGFMQNGQLIVENDPHTLRGYLAGRILTVKGQPIRQIAKIIESDPAVVGVQTFGTMIHARVSRGQARAATRRLRKAIRGSEVVLDGIQVSQPGLEDVFIALLDQDAELQAELGIREVDHA